MEKSLPQIPFNKSRSAKIEVMRLERFVKKLTQIKDHDPFSPHRIEFFLLIILTEGVYSHYVDFESYELHAGDVLIVAKNQVHHFGQLAESARGYSLIFSQQFLDQHPYISQELSWSRLFNYNFESPLIKQRDVHQIQSLNLLFTSFFREYEFKYSPAKQSILASFLRIVLLKIEENKFVQSQQVVNSYWLEIYFKFKRLLEVNYIKSRNSRFYAGELSVSYKFLNDVVKKMSGKTVKVFIDSFVLVTIKRHLVATDNTVSEISYDCGFEEPANMIKFFRKNTDLTPLKFRAKFK